MENRNVRVSLKVIAEQTIEVPSNLSNQELVVYYTHLYSPRLKQFKDHNMDMEYSFEVENI